MDENERCLGLVRSCQKCRKWIPRSNDGYECPRCGADVRCKFRKVKGYDFCPSHGAPNPDKNFYGKGKFVAEDSNFRLTRLADKYSGLMRDGRYLSTRHSLEIVRNRVVELLQRIEKSEAPERLAAIKKLWERFQRADPLDKIQLAKEIDEELEKAYHDYASWNQVFVALDLDRKLVESEVKIEKDLHSILTAEDAYQLYAKFFAAVIDAVRQSMDFKDPAGKAKILKRIEYEITRIIGEGAEPAGSDDFGSTEGIIEDILSRSGEVVDAGSSEVD